MQHLSHRALNFVGREQEINALTQEVESRLSGSRKFGAWAIRATGGAGKSAFAAEIANALSARADRFPGGVLWTDFGMETPKDAAMRWLREYRKPEIDTGEDEHIRRFHETAGELRPLLVLDNAQSQEQIERLLPRVDGVVTLITTRDERIIPSGVKVVQLGLLPDADAIILLRELVGAERVDAALGAPSVCAI